MSTSSQVFEECLSLSLSLSPLSLSISLSIHLSRYRYLYLYLYLSMHVYNVYSLHLESFTIGGDTYTACDVHGGE